MILADANLLLYAHDRSSAHHTAAAAWLDDCLCGEEPFGLAGSTIVTFLRLATDARVFALPLDIETAVGAIDAILAVPTAACIAPGERHWPIFRELLARTRATRDLVPDAYLAALALENHAVVHTSDRDFDRFTPARIHYPLAPPE